MTRQTNAAALRQVTVALRLNAISHSDAVEILEALVDSYELHAAANAARARREREEYLKTVAAEFAPFAEARRLREELRRAEALDPLPESVEPLVEILG